ncbi:hypothetical protein WICMUC_005687 [Wickerhamomyces mucosus]|uniref:Sugar phosphate transporter domain-containing protein n=1 Tax=Wickerhamomyces mucosus TaxID=1378264 RepID=A0A9P8P837_9ASCO|nr:hypothetical protein WICMUC_005687 [Wickerhamomyces mucosus]
MNPLTLNNPSQVNIHRIPKSSATNSINNQSQFSTTSTGNYNEDNDPDDDAHFEIDLNDDLLPSSSQSIFGKYSQLGACILGWYAFSMTISLYNKWMFDKSNLNLPFPILITSFHQLFLSVLSHVFIYFKPKIRGNGDPNSKHNIEWRYFITRLLPCAASSALDIGAGNLSLRFISLSIYTMVKSSSIAFVLFFGILTKLEKFSFNLLFIVIIMTFGVMLMVNKEEPQDISSEEKDQNNNNFIIGSTLVLFSATMSGLRWVLTQLLLTKKKGSHPVLTISQLSPPMFIILFLIGCFHEGLFSFISNDIWIENNSLKTICIMLFPGFLVFLMTFFEFKILQLSHVLTLSIFGILKEILTIIFSILIFHDHLTTINYIGLGISLLDIAWYNWYRFQESEEKNYAKVKNDIELEVIEDPE